MQTSLNWKMKHWRIGVIFIFIYFACFGRTDITSARTCEPIKIELCRQIGYNETSMPNLVGHELQTDVDLTLQTFSPLIQYGCSAQLNFFLCAAYLPMCTPKVNNPIGPCRGLCETVRARCHPVLQSFGFSWPTSLDCNRFPKDNNHENMCMEGPGEPNGVSGLPIPSTKIKSHQPSCQYLLKSSLYVRLNRSNRCTPLCEADILFEPHEKHLAETWITSWSVASLFIAIMATLCLILSNARWDKKLMPLVICHCLVNVSWAIRILAGRNATACGYDPQFPGISLLLADGLSTSPCSSIFLLRYYFGMCASVWVAILSYRYNLRIRQYIKEAYGNPAVKQDPQNTFFQICAFGLPAIQTVITLVARLVDADELLGTCYVGNQSDKALLLLVAIPSLCYWMISCGYLLTGFLRKKSLKNKKIPAHINGLGTFLMIYNVPSALLLLSMFYQFGNRENWLILLDGSVQGSQKAPLWLYITHPFLELLTGVLASSWAIGPRITSLCKKGNIKQNPVCKAAQPTIKYQQNPYNSASYQTICPPNSIVSTSMASIGTVGRMQKQHIRKYPYAQPLPSLHGSRRTRSSSYRMTSLHSASLGHETVL